MSITQIPPHEAAPANSDVEPHDGASVTPPTESMDSAPPSAGAAHPAWEEPPAPEEGLTGLTGGLGVLILGVVAFIVAAGVTGSVWLLAIGLIGLVFALGLLIAVLMRFIN